MRPHLIPVKELGSAAEVHAQALAIQRRRAEDRIRSDEAIAEQERLAQERKANARRELHSRTNMAFAELERKRSQIALEMEQECFESARNAVTPRIAKSRASKAVEIIKWVSAKTDVPIEQMVSSLKTDKVFKARRRAIRLIKFHPQTRSLSLMAVGRLFGGLDHATVHAAIKRSPAGRFSQPQHRVTSAEFVIVAVKMRLSGKSYPVIGEELKACASTASKIVNGFANGTSKFDRDEVCAGVGMSFDDIVAALAVVSAMQRAQNGHATKVQREGRNG